MINRTVFINHNVYKMPKKWSWRKQDWPQFTFDKEILKSLEEEFLYDSGTLFGTYSHLNENNKRLLRIDLISKEALKTSEIEGEFLKRESIQSSIKRNFGILDNYSKTSPGEQGICEMMIDLYENYDEKLSHEILFKWHEMITRQRRDIQNIAKYRTHNEPMQVISGKMHDPKIHFEAPPSNIVTKEMDDFINWYNNNNLSALTKAAITHLYFVLIHPFEDGNGRIARALTIKSISQSLKEPLLSSLSKIILENKKGYYLNLEKNNKNMEITGWIEYFAKTITKSQKYTKEMIDFLMKKAKIYQSYGDKINDRQKKLLKKLFDNGVDGFEGGISAENYMAITKSTRPTSTRDLKDLMTKGILIRKGELKWSRYYLK